MAERPMYNEDDDLFNYQPLEWLRKHRGDVHDDPLWGASREYHKTRIELQGTGVSIDLHANGTWTLEDTRDDRTKNR